MSAAALTDTAPGVGTQPEAVRGSGLVDPAPPRQSREFAGLPISTIVLGVLLLAVLLWAAWATRELLELKQRRVVSVSLSTLVTDFVAAQARAGGSPEEAALRTKLYLASVQGAMAQLNDGDTTILVSEAVVGNSVPDITPQLKAALASRLGAPTGG